jgi:hypothetical protein
MWFSSRCRTDLGLNPTKLANSVQLYNLYLSSTSELVKPLASDHGTGTYNYVRSIAQSLPQERNYCSLQSCKKFLLTAPVSEGVHVLSDPHSKFAELQQKHLSFYS